MIVKVFLNKMVLEDLGWSKFNFNSGIKNLSYDKMVKDIRDDKQDNSMQFNIKPTVF